MGHCHPDSSPRPHVAACGSPAQRESICAMRINQLESLAKHSHQAARAQEQMNSPTERHACRKLWGGGRNVLKELNARKTQREANLDVFKSSLLFCGDQCLEKLVPLSGHFPGLSMCLSGMVSLPWSLLDWLLALQIQLEPHESVPLESCDSDAHS